MELLSALFLTLLLPTFSFANTEIRNLEATYNQAFILPESITNLIQGSLHAEENELRFNVYPARLLTPLTEVCEPESIELSSIVADGCPSEVWVKLELDSEAWRQYSRFTIRISWPANVRSLETCSFKKLIEPLWISCYSIQLILIFRCTNLRLS